MSSGSLSRDWEGYQAAVNFLENGQYDQLAEALKSAGEQRDQTDDSARENILVAARHISTACSEINTAMVMHRRCYLESRQHKQELVFELNKILEQAFSLRMPENLEEGQGATADSNSQENSHTAAIKPKNVLLQARELFKRTLGAQQDQTKASGTRQQSETVPHRVVTEEPSLAIYYLSPFQVYLDETLLKSWSNGKGKRIFKYLGTRRGQPVAKEILMELFWPDAEPQAARNNLNVAICGLRHALSKANPAYSYILYQDGCYLLNPGLNVWVDYEHFLTHFKAAQTCNLRGKQESAVREYQMAEVLYQQDFLQEDRYEEWPELIRQELKNNHLTLLKHLSHFHFDRHDYESCATLCRKALLTDACYEDFHRLLMRCYSRQGHTHLALRQYHYCRDELMRELNAAPGETTRQLYDQIRLGKEV